MGATLDYDSVTNWIGLAIWAERNLPKPTNDDERLDWLRKLADHAAETGFSLRVGYRASEVSNLVDAVVGEDMKLFTWRIERDIWLPDTSKPKPKYYYVRWLNSCNEWVYMHVGDKMGYNPYTQRESTLKLNWNGSYKRGDREHGALFRSRNKTDASNLKNAIYLSDKVQVTTKPPDIGG